MDNDWKKQIGNTIRKVLVIADQLNVLNDDFNNDITIREAIIDIWNVFEVALEEKE